jgi:hypothetical protein
LIEVSYLSNQKSVLLFEVFVLVPQDPYKFIGYFGISPRVLTTHNEFFIISDDCLVRSFFGSVSVWIWLNAPSAMLTVQRSLRRVFNEAQVELLDRRSMLHLCVTKDTLCIKGFWKGRLSTRVGKCGTAVELRVHTQI